jgi:hypothetical protein
MSLRPVKKLSKSKPTLEGAGVHLRRAFGFGNTSDFDPSSSWTISGTMYRKIIWLGFHGTPIGGLKQSLTSSPEPLITAIAWGTAARLPPVMCSG